MYIKARQTMYVLAWSQLNAPATMPLLSSPTGLVGAGWALDTGVHQACLPRSRFNTPVMVPPLSSLPQALSALAGRWTLVYTSSSLTLEVLGALDQLPHVGVCDLCQTVDPVSLTATNKVGKGRPSAREVPGTRPGVAMGVCDVCQTVDPISLTATNKVGSFGAREGARSG